MSEQELQKKKSGQPSDLPADDEKEGGASNPMTPESGEDTASAAESSDASSYEEGEKKSSETDERE